MAFTVYIGNIAQVDDDTMTNVKTILNGYYNQIVAGTTSSFSGVSVLSSNVGLSPTNTDLLCYIVSDYDNSVVINFNSTIPNGSGQIGNTAYTTGGNGGPPRVAASEVYLDKITDIFNDLASGLAKTIFHELMHNKATMGNSLHAQGGGGLAAETITDGSTLTQGNITFMRSKLSREVTQWVVGFSS